jgi:hypothetical protein
MIVFVLDLIARPYQLRSDQQPLYTLHRCVQHYSSGAPQTMRLRKSAIVSTVAVNHGSNSQNECSVLDTATVSALTPCSRSVAMVASRPTKKPDPLLTMKNTWRLALLPWLIGEA